MSEAFDTNHLHPGDMHFSGQHDLRNGDNGQFGTKPTGDAPFIGTIPGAVDQRIETLRAQGIPEDQIQEFVYFDDRG